DFLYDLHPLLGALAVVAPVDISFHAIKERRGHREKAFARKSIRHRTDMLVNPKNLLHHDQSRPRLPLWLGHIGIQFVTVTGLQLHYFAHTPPLCRSMLYPRSRKAG